MSEQENPIPARAAGFPEVDRAAWRKSVEQELGGTDYDRALRSQTPEGIVLEPLYSAEDGQRREPAGVPGWPPFTRGAHPLPPRDRTWETCQLHQTPDLERLNRELKADLGGGVGAFWLRLDRGARLGLDAGDPGAGCHVGQDGITVHAQAGLDGALRDIPLAAVRLFVDAGGNALPAAALTIALLRERGVDPARAGPMFLADPLGALATDGILPCSLRRAEQQLAWLARHCARHLPKSRAVLASSLPYHDAGAHAAQELGFLLATTAHYLRVMTRTELGVEEALGQVAWRLAVGRDFFTGIAKLRAARFLWSLLLRACECQPGPRPWLHAVTSSRSLSKRDPWINMLRVTVETLAAVGGGADCVTSAAFDQVLGEPESLGRRIARNTQSILAEESLLGRVIDPAGGSYYVEALTSELARDAWGRFREIERHGGMAECLRGGFIHERIAASSVETCRAIQERRLPITGVSEFPQGAERKLSRCQQPAAAVVAAAAERVAAARRSRKMEPQPDLAAAPDVAAACLEAAATGATLGEISRALAGDDPPASIEPLFARRDAWQFEWLRDAADRLAETGRRPRVYLACLGPPTEHNARAAFMQNLLMTGGLEVIVDTGTGDLGPEEAARALGGRFRQSGARIACICGTDERYEGAGEDTSIALKNAGAALILLAGRPGQREKRLRAAGVDHFAFLGCNVVRLLVLLLKEFGELRADGFLPEGVE